MSAAGASIQNPSGAGPRVLVREPLGTRELEGAIAFGGPESAIVVPGVATSGALVVERGEGEWRALPARGAGARLNGESFGEARELHRGDTISLGEAQIFVAEASADELALEVHHLAGNATLPPIGFDPTREAATEEEDLEIRATGTLPAARPAVARGEPPRRRRGLVLAALAAALALLGLFLVISSLQPVPIDVRPEDARVRSADGLVSWRSGDTLFLLPGTHRVRAEHPEFRAAEQRISVIGDTAPPTVRLRLEKLPGRLAIDTGGIAATVSVDGAEVGRAPGTVEAPAGQRTITLRAPRYLEHVVALEVEGGGRTQELEATLKPAWGTLNVSAEPAGASIVVDDRLLGPAPRSLQLDAGVHRLRISAQGFKTWESSVVVRAGETQSIGPIALGAPDAMVTVRSEPAGAQVLVGGVYRGRTPVELALAPGLDHEIAVTRAGYTSFEQRLFAESGERTIIDARLTALFGQVSVSGEPAGAEVFVGGQRRGSAPLAFRLPAGTHSLEIRREGFEPQAVSVLADAQMPRTIEYKLLPRDRGQAALQTAPVIETRVGYRLRLVPGGEFDMGSGRREQGRRPNETQRRVTLSRPFYLGEREVTNAEFRRFRKEHASGFLEKRSFDLDDQPVVAVSWDEAVEFCNWLSEQEGLPPAYERSGDRFVLKTPVNNGYRLPTEAEWEYAARFAAPGRTRRFAWGDALPVPAQAGNIAGTETQGLVETSLGGYRDEFVVTAPVGKFPANALGFHDMEGNASEWTNDFYSSFAESTAATDPLGPAEGQRRVVRGPSWRTANTSELRLAARDGADGRSDAIGFRVARYLDAS